MRSVCAIRSGRSSRIITAADRPPPTSDHSPHSSTIPSRSSGRRLRSACLALLERYGELPLAELHSHLPTCTATSSPDRTA